MAWLYLTILAVLIYASSGLFHRILMKDEGSDPFAQSVVFFGIAGLFAFIFSMFRGGFQYKIPTQDLILFIPLLITTTIGPVLLFKGLKAVEASESSILQAIQKLWTVLGAFIFLGELFSIKQILGTLVVIFGVSIAIWKQKRIQINSSVGLILASTFFYAAADLISYFLSRSIDPFSLIVYICFLPVITIILIRPKTLKHVSFYFKPKYAGIILFLGLCDTLGTVSTFYAYQIGRNVAQITPILETTTILSVLAGIIFLKERDNMVKKIIGSIIVLLGVFLIV